jgi:hypothetical protein
MRKKCKIFLVGIVLCVWFTGCQENKIDFSAQVKPIINKRCISCHGGVKRNAKLSLLFRHEALDTAESGKLAIVPGDPGHSELVRRINAKDPEERMPYKEEPLTKAEIDILTQWIKEGANGAIIGLTFPPNPLRYHKTNYGQGFSAIQRGSQK